MSLSPRLIQLLALLRLLLTLVGLLYVAGELPISADAVIIQNVAFGLIVVNVWSYCLEKQILLQHLVLPSLILDDFDKDEGIALPPVNGLTNTVARLRSTLIEARIGEQLIVDYAVDVVLCVDESLTVLECNFSCLKYWHLGRSEIIGKSILELVSSEYVAPVRDAFARARLSNMRQLCEVCVLGSEDHRSFADVQIEWSFNNLLFYCQCRDITKDKLLELYKREYVAMISHDLRSPLTSIDAFLTILGDNTYGVLTDRGKSALRVTRCEGERLLRLTAELLDLSKLESGTIVLNPECHQIAALIERALNTVIAAADEKNIALTAKSVDVDIIVDGDRVVQILVNFLSNAIKFSATHTTVSIDAELHGRKLTFNVHDQGRGIPPELQGEIFGRFKQSRNEDAQHGTGLGLAICKLLSNALGGCVGVSSIPGKGSTFWLSIPVAEQ